MCMCMYMDMQALPVQLIAEMQMLVDNENLKVYAAQSWDEVVPKVFKQM